MTGDDQSTLSIIRDIFVTFSSIMVPYIAWKQTIADRSRRVLGEKLDVAATAATMAAVKADEASAKTDHVVATVDAIHSAATNGHSAK